MSDKDPEEENKFPGFSGVIGQKMKIFSIFPR